METLVLGHPGAERSRLESLISDAGHTVSACHDGSWACHGMDGDCPVDGGSVDVAVAVVEPGDRFDAQGIACVFRARIPIVTVGATHDDPVLRYSTTNVADIDGSVIDAIESSASDASGHQSAIERALAEHVRPGEVVDVSVSRSPRRLDIQLVADVDEVRAASLADCARSAARGHDARVSVIDVSVAAPSG
jgi:hypothetical protein